MEMGMGKLGIPPSEFFKLTLRMFWLIFYGRFGRPKPEDRPISMKDVRAWEKRIDALEAERRKAKELGNGGNRTRDANRKA